MGAIGWPSTASTAEKQQALIAGVGDAVAGFGQQPGRAGEQEAGELRDRGSEVGEEGRDDCFATAVLHARHATDQAEGVVLSTRGNSMNVRPGVSLIGAPLSSVSVNGNSRSARVHVPWM